MRGDFLFDEINLKKICLIYMKELYHITWVTHCSRVSPRMIEYKVKSKEGIRLDNKSEVFITKIILDIIIKDRISCWAYNICRDHVHVVIES